nr:MAG TPA: protein of unknown function (DUF4145) [Caudoviricetes sp.]
MTDFNKISSQYCPFCGVNIPTSTSACARDYRLSFDGIESILSGLSYEYEFSGINIQYLKCPSCSSYLLNIKSDGTCFEPFESLIYPATLAKHFPKYIPEQIRKDYEEAYSIVSLSPKASATLSRRCLQGMIHDFWGITEKNLNAEITSLKPLISPSLWKAIDGIRTIGNIGAHMESDINVIVDIEPGEAEKLLKLIEHLIKEWYINRHDAEILFNEVNAISDEKKAKAL